MIAWQILFWFSCFAVFYNYAGYAILIAILNRLRRPRPEPAGPFYPFVSFIVAAYKEEDCIEKKVQDSLAQNYPADRIEFLFITDGSTDGTMEIIQRYPAVRLLHRPERRGKTAALNRAVQEARGEVLIFCDANTMLNPDAVQIIANRYADPRVGGVAGEKKVITMSKADQEVGAGEGLYWKYESTLKKLDSDFHSVVGAAGELFSLRKSLYEPVPDKVVLDDFIISMRVAMKGYRVVYEPAAFAMELPSFSMGDEKKRKIRIAAGGFQAMGMLSGLLNVRRQPRLSFLYISHRVLRWTLSPVCLVLAFIANLALWLGADSLFYDLLFYVQLAFYSMAVLALVLPAKPFRLASYFVFMNVSVILGFFRFLRGKQPAAWEKAKRQQAISEAP